MAIPSVVFKVDCLAADGFHALNEKHSREATAPDFVRNVAAVLFDANRREFFCQIGVAEVPTLELGFQKPFDLSLPIPTFRRHDESSESMMESS
jgi:hypothetical protein